MMRVQLNHDAKTPKGSPSVITMICNAAIESTRAP